MEWKDVIQGNEAWLVEKTDISVLFLNMLKDGEVISEEHRQKIEACSTSYDKAGLLYRILLKRPIQTLEAFGNALNSTRQEHVYERLISRTTGGTRLTAAAENPPSSQGFSTSLKTNNAIISHVIPVRKDRKGNVCGLTVHGDELFLAREGETEGLIEVYNATTFTFIRNIKVKDIEEDGSKVSGLTSCESNKCLYVGYCYGDNGYIVRMELTGDNEAVKWKIQDNYWPQGLSVNSEDNLVVACWGRQSNAVIEYKSRGERVREILLQYDVIYPHHAIQLDSSQFLVSHGDYQDSSLHRTCLVDASGRVLLSYGNEPGSESGHWPQHLAVDRDGLVFVADYWNSGIVVLDRTLKWSRGLRIVGGDGGVKKPYSLYLDVKRNLLFVGEWNRDDSRVVIVTV